MKKIVSGAEMKEIDRRAIEEFKIPSLTLMENAGRGVADIVAEIAKDAVIASPGGAKQSIVVFCGKGNNGGDGLVAARYLADRGFPVTVLLFAAPSELKGDADVNFKRLPKSVRVEVVSKEKPTDYSRFLQRAGVIVDALFGVGLKSDLLEPYRRAVEAMNQSGKSVVAVDIPSGLDADTGEIRGVAVKAAVTVTLGLAKKGLYEKEGPSYSGQIRVVDIGIPKEAYG